jgi:hypothetical protein
VWAAGDDFILAFIYVFLARCLARVPGWGWKGIAAGLAGYWLLSRGVTMPFPEGALNGSYNYFPALLAVAGLAVWAGWRKRPGTRRLALGAGVFAVALAFRTVDLALCDAWPIGTHAVWHCLNAVVLWLVATGLVAEKPATAGSRPRAASGFGSVLRPSPGINSAPRSGKARRVASPIAASRPLWTAGAARTRRASGDSTADRSTSSAGRLNSAHSCSRLSSIAIIRGFVQGSMKALSE